MQTQTYYKIASKIKLPAVINISLFSIGHTQLVCKYKGNRFKFISNIRCGITTVVQSKQKSIIKGLCTRQNVFQRRTRVQNNWETRIELCYEVSRECRKDWLRSSAVAPSAFDIFTILIYPDLARANTPAGELRCHNFNKSKHITRYNPCKF